MLAAVRHEARPEDGAVARELPFVAGHFSKRTSKLSPGCRSLSKSICAAEDLRQRHRELDRLSRSVDGRDDRRMLGIDAAANRLTTCRLLLVAENLAHRATRAGRRIPRDDAEESIARQSGTRIRRSMPSIGANEAVGPIGPELARIEDRASARRDRGLDEGRRELMRPRMLSSVAGGTRALDGHRFRFQLDVRGPL